MKKLWRLSCFTLVELLVVIGIIAVLAGMLIPALNKARDRAVLLHCSGNLKQIGAGMAMYQNDYNDFYPKAILSQRGSSFYYWTQAFVEEKYVTLQTFSCKSSLQQAKTEKVSFVRAFHQGVNQASDGWQFAAYGLNTHEMGGRELTDNCPYLQAGKVRKPSRFLVASEATALGSSSNRCPSSRLKNRADAGSTITFPYHVANTMVNTLRGDGHVEAIAGHGVPDDIPLRWHSEGGLLGSRYTENNVWTWDGNPRSTDNRL